MTVLYVDTIGFLSQLPHQLIDSFSATLEDIKHSVRPMVFKVAVVRLPFVDRGLVCPDLPGSAGSCQRHQSSGDGEPEGERTERSQESTHPRQADQLHDRSPQ